MANAKKDDNGFPTMMGISCVDGITPVRITFNPSGGGMKVDSTTVISVVPSSVFQHMDDNDYPIRTGVSSVDGVTVLPWYVNPADGSVLIEP